jgi:hypothetical protein
LPQVAITMKQIVSEEIVEQVVDAFEAASREERDRLERRCGRFQQELTAFTVVRALELPDRERALTIGLMSMIYDAFIRSGATFRHVRRNEILHAWKLSPAFVRDLKRGENWTRYAEPEVLEFVLDIVLDQKPATLVDEAPQLVAARILQTVIACLNRAGTPLPSRR